MICPSDVLTPDPGPGHSQRAAQAFHLCLAPARPPVSATVSATVSNDIAPHAQRIQQSARVRVNLPPA